VPNKKPTCTWKGTTEHKSNAVQTKKKNVSEDSASQKMKWQTIWVSSFQFCQKYWYLSTSGWQEQEREGDL